MPSSLIIDNVPCSALYSGMLCIALSSTICQQRLTQAWSLRSEAGANAACRPCTRHSACNVPLAACITSLACCQHVWHRACIMLLHCCLQQACVPSGFVACIVLGRCLPSRASLHHLAASPPYSLQRQCSRVCLGVGVLGCLGIDSIPRSM